MHDQRTEGGAESSTFSTSPPWSRSIGSSPLPRWSCWAGAASGGWWASCPNRRCAPISRLGHCAAAAAMASEERELSPVTARDEGPASESSDVDELRRRLDEALHTLDAIQNGSVDAVA